jgi:hypothetical protein
MYNKAELQKIGRNLIAIKAGQVTTKAVLEEFKKSHSWSRDILSKKTDIGKRFKNICNGRHSILLKIEPKKPEDLGLPITHQTKPRWVEIQIPGENDILIIKCHSTHAAGKFIPESANIEPIEVRKEKTRA